MMNCNIILCGFMGSGKSTVGLLLAKKLGMSFIDLDTYIEKKEGMTVSKISEKYGEPYFRKVEKESAKELAEKNGLVIAAGGGTLVDKENADTFRTSGKIVLLDLPVEVIAERLKGDNSRPLLQRPDKDKAMRELYEKRMPLYKSAADITVDAAAAPLIVCGRIIDAIS